MNKDVRWKQRFTNLDNAFSFLEEGLKKDTLNPYEEAGIIKSFEFTFELSWKTVKDFLESMGTNCPFARDVIKEGFNSRIIEDGHLWLEMLEKRNLLTHTYNRKQATDAVHLIKNRFFSGLKQVYQDLKTKCSD